FTERILSAPRGRPERLSHRPAETEHRIRLVSVIFADYDLPLTLQFVGSEERIDECGGKKTHSSLDAVRRHGQVIVHALFARRSIEFGAKLGRLGDELVGHR